jgi:hypothetical protein
MLRKGSAKSVAGGVLPDPPGLTRRTALGALAGAGVVGALQGCGRIPPAARPTGRPVPTLRWLGETRLPHRLSIAGTTVGGLSAIDRDPATGRWFALSDDRSDLQPARFYTLALTVGPRGLEPPQDWAAVTLRQPDGTPFASRRAATMPGAPVVDPEGLRWRPETGTLLWSSEGDRRLGQPPSIHECTPEGRHLRSFVLPPHLRQIDPPERGVRDNLGFEGLALTPDGAGLWAAMEAPLIQDGPVPAPGLPGGPCRFTLFNVARGEAVRQVAYQPDAVPVPPRPDGAFADNGVSEILMFDAHRLLVLERAFVTGFGNALRLYLVDTRAGSDTLRLDTLTDSNHRPLPKTLVLDFADAGLPRLDNTEGMAWGPRLPNGRRSLVFVSDDNFNPRQITQFLAFECIESTDKDIPA